MYFLHLVDRPPAEAVAAALAQAFGVPPSEVDVAGWWWYRRPDPLPWDEDLRPCHQPGQRSGPVGTADGDGGGTDGARPQENTGQITP